MFGQIKLNRKIDRFLRRGRSAARSEWRVAAATHNLLKLHTHQLAVCGLKSPLTTRGTLHKPVHA